MKKPDRTIGFWSYSLLNLMKLCLISWERLFSLNHNRKTFWLWICAQTSRGCHSEKPARKSQPDPQSQLLPALLAGRWSQNWYCLETPCPLSTSLIMSKPNLELLIYYRYDRTFLKKLHKTLKNLNCSPVWLWWFVRVSYSFLWIVSHILDPLQYKSEADLSPTL